MADAQRPNEGPPTRLEDRRRRRWRWPAIAVLVAVPIVVGALVLQPWLLFVDVRVEDAIPSSAAQAEPATAPPAATDGPSATPAPPPAGPVTVSSGTFVSHEHTTTGTARILRLSDGRHQLALENLDTSSGPDVRVWLSAGPVIEGTDGWRTAADHPHVELAPIKGNKGDQLYDIPAGVDLSAYPTVALWCVRFGVSFGAAALTAQPG
jgi:hypothetical protein